MPACEGIETLCFEGLDYGRFPAKRMPACEGIETIVHHDLHVLRRTAKRMPACEGIETACFNASPFLAWNRQEDARL